MDYNDRSAVDLKTQRTPRRPLVVVELGPVGCGVYSCTCRTRAPIEPVCPERGQEAMTRPCRALLDKKERDFLNTRSGTIF